ncbi:MAG: STAS domain-containing protein, partial [Acidobacteria bacterium]|nr:STAS domain-containing protein [Acidobacteriota bacterium]
SAAQPLVVSLAALTAIDLCGLQLLCSAQRSCQTNSLPFTLCAVPDWFQATVHTAGFHQHPAFQVASLDAVREDICA